MNQIELEEDLQRLTGAFSGRMAQAVDSMATSMTGLPRLELEQLALDYHASVLDIACGPTPEVNLLDMMATLKLGEVSVEDHWIPNVFGEIGAELATVFSDTSAELRAIAVKVLSPAQVDQVREVVVNWRRENPDLVHLAGVRMFRFSEVAGELASERDHAARGILSTVRSATQSADQALLLGNRAMFLAQRLPFLVRHQARVVAQEIILDSLDTLRHADGLIPDAAVVAASRRFDRLLGRWLIRGAACGAGLIALYWGGYVAARRAVPG